MTRSTEPEPQEDDAVEQEERTQETPGGITIPVPSREQVERDLRKVTRLDEPSRSPQDDG
jgi:hypothetical protein